MNLRPVKTKNPQFAFWTVRTERLNPDRSWFEGLRATKRPILNVHWM
ncbi:MAG: hypothetical protein JO145_05650 [Acidobacteriaceae bacterium]|nr:hypothetical protein [Acidobacteriaceae bacterium]